MTGMWLRGAGKGKSTGRPELLEKSKEKSIHRYIDLRDVCTLLPLLLLF